MRAISVVFVACTVASVAAFQYPDFVPLSKRQAPGTPEYECHANCGGIITASRSDGYCDSSNFKSMLSDCLDCALVYDIWKYYGNSVSSAAENCGLDATPVEPTSSSASTTSTATGTITSSETESETASTSAVAGSSSEDATPTEIIADSTIVRSTSVTPTATTPVTPTPPSSATSTIPTPSDPEFTGGTTLNAPGGLLMGGLVGAFVAVLI